MATKDAAMYNFLGQPVFIKHRHKIIKKLHYDIYIVLYDLDIWCSVLSFFLLLIFRDDLSLHWNFLALDISIQLLITKWILLVHFQGQNESHFHIMKYQQHFYSGYNVLEDKLHLFLHKHFFFLKRTEEKQQF